MAGASRPRGPWRGGFRPLCVAAALLALACAGTGSPANAARIGQVRVRGNRVLSTSEVRARLGLAPGGVFDSAFAAAGLDALLGRYRDLGRYDACARVDSRGDTSQVDLDILVEEGAQVRVSHWTVLGASALDWARLGKRLELRPGEPFSEEALEQDVAQVLDAYGELGRPYATLRPQGFTEDSAGLSFVYVVDEGPPVALKEFQVQGNVRTHTARVVRESGLHVGETYRASRVRHAVWRLKSLGAFDDAQAGLVQARPGVLQLRVREGGASTAEGVLGYASESHSVTGLFHLDLNNLGGGRAAKFYLDARGNGVTEYQLAYREPQVFATPVGLSAGVSQHLEDTLYTQSAITLGFQAEAAPYALVTLTGSWERTVSTVGPTSLDRAYKLQGGIQWDHRDDPLSPSRGFLVKLQTQLGFRDATPRIAGPSTRYDVREDDVGGESYLPLGLGTVLALSGRAQALHTDEFPVPIYEQYPLGGALSLRGYQEQQFRGPVVGLATTELRRLLPGRRGYAFVFAEAGFVREEIPDDAGGAHIVNLVRPAVGLGIRAATGLGLLGLDYAWGDSFDPLGGKIHVSLRSQF